MTDYTVSIYRKDNGCNKSIEGSCANGDEHTENNKQSHDCKQLLNKFLNGLPFSTTL